MVININFKEKTLVFNFKKETEFKASIDAIHCAAAVFQKMRTSESDKILEMYPFFKNALRGVKIPYVNFIWEYFGKRCDEIKQRQVLLRAIESHYGVEFKSVDISPQMKKGYATKFGAFNKCINSFNSFKNLIESKEVVSWDESGGEVLERLHHYVDQGFVVFRLFESLDVSWRGQDRFGLNEKLKQEYSDLLENLGAIDALLVGKESQINWYIIVPNETDEEKKEYYYDEKYGSCFIELQYNIAMEVLMQKTIEKLIKEVQQNNVGKKYFDSVAWDYFREGSIPHQEAKAALPPDDPTVDLSDWLYEKD